MDNVVLQEKTPREVMSDVFGLSKNKDYELVYDSGEIWKKAQILATKQVSPAGKTLFITG